MKLYKYNQWTGDFAERLVLKKNYYSTGNLLLSLGTVSGEILEYLYISVELWNQDSWKIPSGNYFGKTSGALIRIIMKYGKDI